MPSYLGTRRNQSWEGGAELFLWDSAWLLHPLEAPETPRTCPEAEAAGGMLLDQGGRGGAPASSSPWAQSPGQDLLRDVPLGRRDLGIGVLLPPIGLSPRPLATCCRPGLGFSPCLSCRVTGRERAEHRCAGEGSGAIGPGLAAPQSSPRAAAGAEPGQTWPCQAGAALTFRDRA